MTENFYSKKQIVSTNRAHKIVKSVYKCCNRKHVEEKQPRMARMSCSPSIQFSGKYNNKFVLGNTQKTQYHNSVQITTTSKYNNNFYFSF